MKTKIPSQQDIRLLTEGVLDHAANWDYRFGSEDIDMIETAISEQAERNAIALHPRLVDAVIERVIVEAAANDPQG